MPVSAQIEHRVRLDRQVSLLVTRELLRQILEVGQASGWRVFSIEIRQRKGAALITLPDLASIEHVSPLKLEDVYDLEIAFVNDKKESNFSFLLLRDVSWHSFRESCSFFSISDNEGDALAFREGVSNLLVHRGKWYSQLSGPWPYAFALFAAFNVEFFSVLARILRGAQHAPPHVVVDISLGIGLCSLCLMCVRRFFFPSMDFNLADPPLERTPSMQTRGWTWKLMVWLAGAVSLALIAKFFRR